MMKKHLLIIFLLIWTSLSFAQYNQSIRFLVISDWGGYGADDQKAVAVAMDKEAENIHAQFVVTAGDNFHGEGIDSEKSPRWKTEFEDIYDGKYLQIPWYPTLGNHDNRGNAEAELNYTPISTRWKFPSRYYIQEESAGDSLNVLIVHLDTSPFIREYHNKKDKYHLMTQDQELQLHWLDSVLLHSKSLWKIVVGHHPVFSAATSHGDQQDIIDNILPVLQKYHIPVYINGHDHILQHLQNNEMDFFICGGGAKPRDVIERNDVVFGVKSLGFMSIIIDKDGMHANFIDSENKVLHSAFIPPSGK
jgi:tartrate-resistant acid phosphatase type 5